MKSGIQFRLVIFSSLFLSLNTDLNRDDERPDERLKVPPTSASGSSPQPVSDYLVVLFIMSFIVNFSFVINMCYYRKQVTFEGTKSWFLWYFTSSLHLSPVTQSTAAVIWGQIWLIVRCSKTKFGSQAFSIAGPVEVCNCLLQSVQSTTTICQFKRKWKAYYFEHLEGPGDVVLIVLVLAGQTNFAMTLDLFLPTSGDRPFYGAMVEQCDGPSWLHDDNNDDDFELHFQ